MEIAYDLETPAYSDFTHVAGLSYDFRKAFDLIPVNLMLYSMETRGAHSRILRPMRALYQGLVRVFKLQGAIGNCWKASTGIIQGDAMSMVAFNSVITCIIEFSESLTVPCALTARSYADDISAVALGKSSQAIQHGLRGFHSVVRAYEQTGLGEINHHKTFTFGHVFPQYTHMKEFRIVGGSLVAREEAD